MTATRRVAATATDLACKAVGRRAVIRAARYVVAPSAGTNSLHAAPGATLTRESVRTETLDAYAERWGVARFAFEFLARSGYRTGKLTPRGVEFYPGWDPDLETFVEGNYVACTPATAGSLPAVPWWKAV